MRRSRNIALAFCLAVLGTAIARADCQHVVGSITEAIIPAPNDPLGRALGNVNGALNGADTAVITSSGPDGLSFTSFDVILTNRGDTLTANGAGILTPVPGNSNQATLNVTLAITGGSGKYTGATGTLTYKGLANFNAGTFSLIYRGSVCAPNLKDERN
jgi:hypothetical protein